MIFLENRLPADDSHEISCLICYFGKKQQNLKFWSAANYRWRFMGPTQQQQEDEICHVIYSVKSETRVDFSEIVGTQLFL